MSILSYKSLERKWITAEDVKDVVEDLRKIENIEILEFTGNTMSIEAANAISEPLSAQKKISVLRWNDLFTGRLKSEISVALKSLSCGLMRAQVNLVEINLSDNAFGPNGVVGVTDLIGHQCCYTLKVLNMNNQGLGHQGCWQLVNALKKGRTESNFYGLNLEVFIAGRNRLENAGLEMLTEVFADGMSSLKELVLLQNGIGIHGIEGVHDLVKILENHDQLRKINVSDNTIKPEGMKELYKLLSRLSNLEEIHLNDCLLGNRGLKYLRRIVEDYDGGQELKLISISGNEIQNNAAERFVSTLLDMKPWVTQLDMRENDVSRGHMTNLRELASQYEKNDFFLEDSDDEESSVLLDDDEIDEEEDESEGSDSETDGESDEEYEETGDDFDMSKSGSVLDNEIDAEQEVSNIVQLLTAAWYDPVSLNSSCLLPQYRADAAATVAHTDVVAVLDVNPEATVRLAMLLCVAARSHGHTFELGIALLRISLVNHCVRATNALLVELDVLKGEEKQLVPAFRGQTGSAVRVLEILLSGEELAASAKLSLVTVLRNLSRKVELDRLVNKMEQSMTGLII